jgi:ABC-type cobalamin/Fe3+-siderophores transport system ATPase subunit
MITINNLTISYDTTPLLHIDNLSIPDKDAWIIIGDNGTGKSSLIKRILYIDKVFKGDILIDSKNNKSMSRLEIARLISYLPQNSNMDIDIPTDLFIKQGNYGFDNPDPALFTTIIEILGIQNLLDKNIRNLSGGEKQLARIARAFVAPTKYCFLDEPDSYLSRKNKSKFLELVKYFSAQRNITIISHGEITADGQFKTLLELWAA